MFGRCLILQLKRIDALLADLVMNQKAKGLKTGGGMYLFALSTAEQGAGMALFENGSLVFESSLFTRQTHSKRLLVMIQQAIGSQSGLLVDQVDGFIAARGPGSFTGLRIGISMIKGLAKAASKPCAGASSLDGIAFRFSCADLPVCVMMDAKRNEVYTALYQFHGGILEKKSRETVCPAGSSN